MPPSLEKPKRKKQKQKQKQKQQQTVIVNINKQKRENKAAPRNGIEKPKEQKEQPKTFNSFSFSSPAQTQIGEYLKGYNKDLFSKIEQSIKSRDAVINSTNESLNPIISVKSVVRKPTVLETIPVPITLDTVLKKKEPLIIGEPLLETGVTTLDSPESLSLDEPASPLLDPEPEEITKDTVEFLKKVEEPPDLFKLLSSPEKPVSPKDTPIQLGAPIEPVPKKRGRPSLTEEEKLQRAENKALITRPVGRPFGTTNDSLRARLNNQLYVDTENPPKFASVKPIRQQSEDLVLPSRIQRRKEESLFTGISESNPPPQRRSSISFGSRLGSPL